MKKKSSFFYYTAISIFWLLIINNFCCAHNYEVNRELDGKKFICKIPDSISKKYEQKVQTLSSDVENLFNEPIKILFLYELLQRVSTVLDECKIDYWLSEETLLNYNKFNDFAPWQQDIQIAVDYDKFKKHLTKITLELANKDIVFICYDNVLNLQNLPSVNFTKDGFIKIVKKYEPDLTTKLITKKYAKTTVNEKNLKLYFYPYNISKDGITHAINYLYYVFIKSGRGVSGYKFNDIYPLKTVYLNSLAVKIPNNIANIVKIENRSYYLYQSCEDRTIKKEERCKNLEYIKLFPEVLPLFFDFMRFIHVADRNASFQG